MESNYSIKEANPIIKANIFSKMFFGWIIKLYCKSFGKRLEISDLYKTMKEDSSKKLGDNLEGYWIEESHFAIENNQKPSLLKCLKKLFLKFFINSAIIYFFIHIILTPLQSMAVAFFVATFSKGDNLQEQLSSGSILILITFALVFTHHQACFYMGILGMRYRVALTTLIYKKILKTSSSCLNECNTGKIMNLLSNDVSRFDYLFIYIHHLWLVPLKVAVIGYLLWLEVGVSCLAGVCFLLLIVTPWLILAGKISSNLCCKTSEETDIRMRLMNEVISAIKVIKMYAWEKPFKILVEQARKRELKYIFRNFLVSSLSLNIFSLLQNLSTYLTMICFDLLSQVPTSSKVFSAQIYFGVLRNGIIGFFPKGIEYFVECLVSIKRIEEFLLLHDSEYNISGLCQNKEIIFDRVTAGWTKTSRKFHIPYLKIAPGSLCAIIGPVGAGKSSVIQMIIGELKTNTGLLKIKGTISYASQEPWLFGSSVRSNILFGQEYVEEKYNNVIKATCLELDFKEFSHGDLSLVGERGLILSGGQRARINLARALYRDADIYLLDDPLSAVDTNVGNQIFEECVMKYLAGKTRVLITHQLQYITNADLIVVMDEGRVEVQGTFSELTKCNFGFTKMFVDDNKVLMKEKTTEVTHETENSLELSVDTEAPKTAEETRPRKIRGLWEYLKRGGGLPCTICIVFFLVASQAMYSLSDFWLSKWIRTYTAPKRDMPIYSTIILIAILVTIMKYLVTYQFVQRASRNLHRRMFSALMKTRIKFFDTNPSGRILNRFTMDLGIVDQEFPSALLEASQFFLILLGSVVLVIISSYYMIVGCAFIIGLILFVQIIFVKVSQQIKHLEALVKSPVFSHVNYTLQGITTIRSHQKTDLLKTLFNQHQDVHSASYYIVNASTYCFCLWTDFIVGIFIVIVIYGFTLIHYYYKIEESVVGLAVSQALSLTFLIQYGVKRSSDTINYLTSVERIVQYSRLEQEEKPDKPNEHGSVGLWPKHGKLEFKNVCLQYEKEGNVALKNLNFVIEGGQKIGIVGRTGAGKSSLISVLFRMLDYDGNIFIDGIDTKTVRLHYLRENISIIPQEPLLFSDTIRYNLDPSGEFPDEDIWNAIDAVEMRGVIPSLNYVVLEAGGNFSLGQKQLLCLARAILHKTKVLMMDEATANVDSRTDELIQTTIRKMFLNCTVLTIAHRLKTIIDSDKVMVMHLGKIVEFDHPYNLLKDRHSLFNQFILETGPIMAKQLTQMAYDVYMSKEI